MHNSFKRQTLLIHTVGILLLFGLLISKAFALATPSLQQIDQKSFDQQLTAFLTNVKAAPLNLDIQVPNQQSQVTITPMFSSERGSWPFESFANNNLFRVIATYQTHHPRMVVIKGGSITLSELNKRINNPVIMRPFQDGYLLSYPLLIEENAALLIDSTSLYLYSHSGTAIINLGLLSLNKAKLTSWANQKPVEILANIAFRPFITNWGGSHLRITNSEITRLGYNGYLVQGISSTLNNNQPANTPKVQIEIVNSDISNLAALDLKHALVIISNSKLSNFQQYAIDLVNSNFMIKDNRIENIKNNSGIRIQENSTGQITRNIIFTANKAAIEVQQLTGNIVIDHNMLSKESRHGVLLNQILTNNAKLLITDNLFTKLTGTAIETNEFMGDAYILNNTIQNNPEYAVSFRNTANQPMAHLIFYKNKINNMGKPILRTLGMGNVTIGHNQLLGSQFYQNLFIGDLLPVQGMILEATLKYPCIVQVNNTTTKATYHLDYTLCKIAP